MNKLLQHIIDDDIISFGQNYNLCFYNGFFTSNSSKYSELLSQNTYNSLTTSTTNYSLTTSTVKVTISKNLINIYDYELQLNEDKRNIKILKKFLVYGLFAHYGAGLDGGG